jgi:hypothetical protein
MQKLWLYRVLVLRPVPSIVFGGAFGGLMLRYEWFTVAHLGGRRGRVQAVRRALEGGERSSRRRGMVVLLVLRKPETEGLW